MSSTAKTTDVPGEKSPARKSAAKKLLIRTDSSSLQRARRIYSLLSTPTQCLNSARRYLFMAPMQSCSEASGKVFMRLELRKSLQALVAKAGNGRLHGLKTSVRMEVAAACQVQHTEVEICDVFESLAAGTALAEEAKSEEARTVIDLIVTSPVQGWNSALDISLTAKALMDQVEKNRVQHDAADDLLSLINVVDVKDHSVIRSARSRNHFFLIAVLVLALAHRYGVLAFTSGLLSLSRMRGGLPHTGCGAKVETLRMQAQTAEQDAPRFLDWHLALAGVVTRAERQAMMLPTRTARLANAGPPSVDAPYAKKSRVSPAPRREGGVACGHGVFLREKYREHCRLSLSPYVHDVVKRIHDSAHQAAQRGAPKLELVFQESEVRAIRHRARSDYLAGQRYGVCVWECLLSWLCTRVPV